MLRPDGELPYHSGVKHTIGVTNAVNVEVQTTEGWSALEESDVASIVATVGLGGLICTVDSKVCQLQVQVGEEGDIGRSDG